MAWRGGRRAAEPPVAPVSSHNTHAPPKPFGRALAPTGGDGAAPARRRTGRPRHDSRPVLGDPTDEILGAAARLFGERGVAGTSMSLIAREVGLKQSSLYYYFRSRDETVLALMRRANVVPL